MEVPNERQLSEFKFFGTYVKNKDLLGWNFSNTMLHPNAKLWLGDGIGQDEPTVA